VLQDEFRGEVSAHGGFTAAGHPHDDYFSALSVHRDSSFLSATEAGLRGRCAEVNGIIIPRLVGESKATPRLRRCDYSHRDPWAGVKREHPTSARGERGALAG